LAYRCAILTLADFTVKPETLVCFRQRGRMFSATDATRLETEEGIYYRQGTKKKQKQF
jgi:hypothetical protein